jgi:hypothetical protein
MEGHPNKQLKGPAQLDDYVFLQFSLYLVDFVLGND